jgi:U3 small nucleolar ribonucleoprotein protein IMP4
MVIQETRGQPDGLLVCHLPLGPTAYFTLSNVVMRHDIEGRGTVSEAYPHTIFEGFSSALGTCVEACRVHVIQCIETRLGK